MIQAEDGHEQMVFISYIENAVSNLANENYQAFLSMFDNSRLFTSDIVLALRFLDQTHPITKIDNPLKIQCKRARIDIGQYSNRSGYWMNYDLSTNGEINDLTLSCTFRKTKDGYITSLEDLHTM